MYELVFLFFFIMNGAHLDTGSTTANAFRWLRELVPDVVKRDTVSKSPHGTLVEGCFEGLTCNEACL